VSCLHGAQRLKGGWRRSSCWTSSRATCTATRRAPLRRTRWRWCWRKSWCQRARPQPARSAARVCLHALYAQRVRAGAYAGGGVVYAAGHTRQPELRAAPQSHHRPLRPLPPPQRHLGPYLYRRRAGLPERTGFFVLGFTWNLLRF
jgi:hypothetical protein